MRFVYTFLVLLGCFGFDAAAKPNLLLITVDTLRADRLGCYGYGLARTPAIDRFAESGARFTDAIASAPITMPSHATIMTGLLPPAHGVRDNGAYRLADEHDTLAELMTDNGYVSGAFVSAVVLGRRYNLDQGFSTYDDELWTEDEPKLFMIRDRSALRTADRAVSWLERWNAAGDAPFFLWVHFFDPHQPYESRYRDRHLVPSAYDAEVAQVDEGVSKLSRWLEKHGQLDETVIVITADHGESLGEHGEQTHAIFVYDATVKVPLIIRYPALLQPQAYEHPVRTMDIFPTVAAMTGLAPKSAVQGVNLLPALRGEIPPPALAQYAESLLSELGFGMAPLHSVRMDGKKWIRAPKPELYDVREDPRELTNLVSEYETISRDMDAVLSDILEDSKRYARGTPVNPLDKETLESLRALGYVTTEQQRADVAGMDPKDGLALYAKLEQARHAAQRADYQASETLLRELLASVPGHITARNVLGLVLVRQDRLDDAEEAYTASLKIDPTQARVHHMLGVIAVRRADYKNATKHCARALAASPQLVESMVILGFSALQQNKQEEAATWYARALEADPAMPRAHLAYGDLFYLQQKFEDALQHYKKVIETLPDHFAALLQAGLCAQRVNDPEAAISFFKRAEKIRPDSWMPPYNLACVESLRGNIDASIALLERAVDLASADADVARIAAADPDFTPIKGDCRFKAVLAKRAAPQR